MGTFFPDDDEYPTYRPIPMSWPRPTGVAITALVGLAIAGNDLLPWTNPQEDPPHREFVDIRARNAMSVNSTSGNSLVGANIDEAANVVIRRHHAVRVDAVRAITASSTFAGPDLL